jgi:hypothetical protein
MESILNVMSLAQITPSSSPPLQSPLSTPHPLTLQVYIDYRNMESILNVMSLGNLNRQFVSLLRSEQDDLKTEPFIGDPAVWDGLLGSDETVHLTKIDEAFVIPEPRRFPVLKFPFGTLAKLVVRNPRVILPGEW